MLALSIGSLSAADKKEILPPPPPMAVASSVTLYRGKSVVIPLRAAGRTPGEIKFLIRSLPASGKLSEIRMTSRNSAEVTYTHNDSSAATDQFTFAAQALDSPVSAPGKVSLLIGEEPTRLEILGDLEFGEVVLGESLTRELVFRNNGGGLIYGEVKLPEPWRTTDRAPLELRLARGQSRTIPVIFQPDEERSYSGSIIFGGKPIPTMRLSGYGAAPLTFSPAGTLEFSSDGTEAGRLGVLVVRNRTSEERKVSFSAPGEIVVPGEVTLPAGQQFRAIFQVEPTFRFSLEGRIRVITEGYISETPFRVFALPPRLVVDPSGVLDFGKIESGGRRRLPLIIRNAGGVDAKLKATLSEGVLMVPDPNIAVLSPGETRRFEAVFESVHPGKNSGSIVLEASGAKPVTIPLSAEIVEIAKGPQWQKPKTLPYPVDAGAAVAGSQPTSGFETGIPPVEAVKVAKAGSRYVVLSWKKPARKVRDYIIEGRTIDIGDDGRVKTTWVPWERILYRENGGSVIADIQNLPKGGTWYIRIRYEDEAGKKSRPSETFRISTPVPPGMPIWVWGIIAMIPIGTVWWILRQRRKAEQAEGDSRLEQLENP